MDKNTISKKVYVFYLQMVEKILGIDAAKMLDARFRYHRSLNLKAPVTLADKVAYIELHEQSPLAPLCTDKYAARDYVISKGHKDILIPLAYDGFWNSEKEIDFDALPQSFVIKATHGCNMNYIVPDKSKLDVEDCKAKLKSWLATTYGTYSVEPHYENVPHRLYAEAYLEDLAGGLIDYKIHCLNGTPRFIMTTSDRIVNSKGHNCKRNLFDMDWNPIYEVINSETEDDFDKKLPKPKCFEKMCSIAKDLSEDFKFVRVDLYEFNNHVYFGELTFSPTGCVFPTYSNKFLNEMGKLLSI